MKRGYKETEVGEIPVEWEVKSIEAITEVKTGGTPSRSNPVFWNGNVPWMSSGEVNNKEIYKTEECITSLAVNNSNAQMLPPETIMMALNGQGKTRGTVAITKIPLTCNQSLAGLICKKEIILPYFAFYYLENEYQSLRHLTGEDARNGLNLGIIREIPIPLPPLPEQKKIAEILSSVDEAIRATQAVIDQTKKLKQGLLNRLLTKGIGHKKFKMTEIGEIPVEWEVEKINTVAQLSSGGTPSRDNFDNYGGDLPWLKSGELNRGVIEYTEESITQTGFDNSSAKWADKGNTLIAMYGATAGVVAYLKIRTTINQAILSLKPSAHIIPEYLFYSIKQVSSKLLDSLQGSGQPNLNSGIIGNCMMPIPPLSEQKKIAEILSSVDEAIRENTNNLEQLKTTKSGLMQDLLTGKKRVQYAQP